MKSRILLILLLGTVILFIGWQLLQVSKFNGNLILNISNQSKIDSVKIEVFENGEKVVSDLFTNEVFHNYKKFVLKTGLGQHTLIFSADDYEVKKEIKVNTLLITWVVVDFYEDDSTAKNNDYKLYITKQRKPLVIE